MRARTTPSDLAAIVDSYGGLRVVVAPARTFRHHVRPGEMLFQVPDFKIREPVPWEKIPYVIALAERQVAWWIRTRNDPADLELEPIRFYRLRQLRACHRSVDLTRIVET